MRGVLAAGHSMFTLRWACGEAQNGSVRTRRQAFIAGIALLVISSVATNAFAHLQSSAKAMACCAKTHGQCAGFRAPDDCCQHMGHSAARSTARRLPPFIAQFVTPATLVPAFIADLIALSEPVLAEPAFTRP